MDSFGYMRHIQTHLKQLEKYVEEMEGDNGEKKKETKKPEKVFYLLLYS